jgi:L-methionine (R)-S-oxide reductase
LTKIDLLEHSVKEIIGLLEDKSGMISDMANTAAILKENLNYYWVGFYIVQDEHLELGPFQGPVACSRISKGRGVCGWVWENERSMNVPNVNKFEDHIQCNDFSKSEIVVPVFNKNKEIMAVMDADGLELNQFDESDKMHLETIASLISAKHG